MLISTSIFSFWDSTRALLYSKVFKKKKKKNLYLYHTTCYLAQWLSLCVLKEAISALSSLMPTSLKTNCLLISQMAYGKNTVLMMWGKLF